MNRRVKDLLILVIGVGVVPAAWFLWTAPSNVLDGYLGYLILSSIFWVPLGLFLLGFWLYDNLISGLEPPRWHASLAKRLHWRARASIPVAVAAGFLMFFGLTTFLIRAGDPEAQSKTFMLGWFALLTGLVITSRGFEERKGDPSRRVHIVTSSATSGSLGGVVIPRAEPPAQQTEAERPGHDRKNRFGIPDLIGFSIIATAILLMIASAFR